MLGHLDLIDLVGELMWGYSAARVAGLCSVFIQWNPALHTHLLIEQTSKELCIQKVFSLALFHELSYRAPEVLEVWFSKQNKRALFCFCHGQEHVAFPTLNYAGYSGGLASLLHWPSGQFPTVPIGKEMTT